MRVDLFDFDLPPDLIAQRPVSPRDSARLLDVTAPGDPEPRLVAPGADFAKFAAGGWYNRTTIPSDKSRWGGFDELAERNWGHVRALVEAAAANPGAPGSNTQKVGDLFASAMDVGGGPAGACDEQAL